jgi:hypothetical protein
MADKISIQECGARLVDLVVALADGVGLDDMEEGTAFLVALAGVGDDLAEDLDSGLLDLLAGAASAYADIRRLPEDAE